MHIELAIILTRYEQIKQENDAVNSLLIDRDEEMTRDDAEEYFNHNIIGSYVGKHTPSFIYK